MYSPEQVHGTATGTDALIAADKAGRRWNLTSTGELVAQMGQQVWKGLHHYNPNAKPHRTGLAWCARSA